MPGQQITDEGSDLRKYRTELPNIIDDLGLDVFERALYGHYKRVCGANGGTCYESTRKTADKIPGMSAGQVSIVRRRLAEKGLITEETEHTIHVKIIDIWDLNFAYYSVKDRPDIAGWTIPQLIEWVNTSVYHLNTTEDEEENCLPPKQGVYQVNTKPEKCLPGKTKNKPIKKEPNKKSAERDFLTDVFNGNLNLRDGERRILQAGWDDIYDPECQQVMGIFVEASNLPIPPPEDRGDWVKVVDSHRGIYGASQLEWLYPNVIVEMRASGLTVSRPGAVTKTMADYWARHKDNGSEPQGQPVAPGFLED